MQRHFPVFFFFWKCSSLFLFFFSEAEQIERNIHPTAMMLTSTVNLLQTLCLSAGVHAEVMQSEATKTLCGLLRMLVESGTTDKTCMQWGVVGQRVRTGLSVWVCVCQCGKAAVKNHHRHGNSVELPWSCFLHYQHHPP